MDIDQMRREYLHGGLTSESLKDDPIDQFQFWLQQAVDGQVVDPTAMGGRSGCGSHCDEYRYGVRRWAAITANCAVEGL